MAKRKRPTSEDWARWRAARRHLEEVIARNDARARERLTFGLLGR
jgi:hypothetical protein